MELFTLGADRGYTETDVREQARALTGWTATKDQRLGRQLPLRPDYARLRDRRGSSASAATSTGATLAGSASTIPRRPSSSRSSGPTSCRSRLASTPQARSSGSTEHGFAVRPVVQAILLHPGFYGGPRMVKPPSSTRRACCGTGPRVDTDSWTWIGAPAGQRLFNPPNVAGWDDTRWLDTGTFAAAGSARPPSRSGDRAGAGHLSGRRPEAAVARALAFWGKPDLADRLGADRVRAAHRGRREHRQQESYRLRQERASHARRDLSRPADR